MQEERLRRRLLGEMAITIPDKGARATVLPGRALGANAGKTLALLLALLRSAGGVMA